MPGMNSGVNVNDPTVVSAFKSALLHQGIIALLIFGVLGLAWLTVRAWLPAAAQLGGAGSEARAAPAQAGRPGASCCGSGSACCGSSTGSCRPSRRWRSGFPRR
jgi:hypothetical protein